MLVRPGNLISAKGGGISEPQIVPFSISKFVAIGDSLEDNSFAWQVIKDMCKAIAEVTYGTTITAIDEQAVSGATVQDQAANIASYISSYTGQPNVVFVNIIGVNNVTWGTQFNALAGATKTSLINSYISVWDIIEAAGHRMIPSGIEYANVSGVLDNDNTVKTLELNGTYTYNRDWIKPIVADRAPEFLKGGELVIDQYEYTRGIHDYGYALPDVIHPNDGGYIMYAVNIFRGVMEASKGRKLAPAVMNNFGVAAQNPSVDLDFVVGCYTLGSVCPNNPNINWIGAPYGNTIPAYFKIQAGNVKTTNGAIAAGVEVILAGASNSYPIVTYETGDRTATLDNSALRNSSHGMTGTAGSVAAYIKGLEPNKLYTIEFAHKRQDDILVYSNSAALTPVSGKTSVTSRADPYGQIFIRAIENNAGNSTGISGFRVRTANAAAPSAPAASPMDDTNLFTWFDASDPLSVNVVSGEVTEWLDKTFNAVHAVAPTLGSRPKYNGTQINGLNVVSVDGTDYLTLPSKIYNISNAENTVYIVYASNNITSDSQLINGRVGTASRWGISHAAGVTKKLWGTSSSTGAASNQTLGTANTSPHIASLRRVGALSYTGLDGSEGASAVADNVVLSSAYIGALNNSPSAPFNGSIAEIRIYSVGHDATRYAAEIAELKAKWGIA